MGKILAAVVVAGALAALLWQHGVFKSAPPPAPPPPPILLEPVPVLGEAELERVFKAARDQDPAVRWQAVVFLDKVHAPQAMPIMRDLLARDPEPQVRVHILQLLSGRHEPEAVQAVLSALNDSEVSVRLAALDALDKIGDYSVAPALTQGPIHDTDDQVRARAMSTLNDLQDKKQREIDAARAAYEEQKRAAAQKR